jgi:predicted nucleic acid-binding Zn ribbon protein
MVWTQESQRKGNSKSSLENKRRMYARIDIYNKSPRLCKYCNAALPYEKRKNIFCSHKCSKKFYNNVMGYGQNTCKRCGTPCNAANVFCSRRCKSMFDAELKLASGSPVGNYTIKTYLIHTRGHKCEKCNNTSWMNNPIPLECHHKDGNRNNNTVENVEIVCPNCHVFTDNYKGKNNHQSK